MEKLVDVFLLCKTAREKGFVVSVRYNGETLGLCHQAPGDYRVIVDMTAFFDAGYEKIEDYLKGLIA